MSHEIGLIYNGKKKPFEYDNPKTGKLRFTPGVVEWVSNKAAEFMTRVNPGMFTKAGERGNPDEVIFEDAAEMIAKKAAQDAADKEAEAPEETEIEEPEKTDGFHVCAKCGRKYKDEEWYNKHIAKCEG